MLRNTFCHVPGVGLQTEKKIWACGLHSWEDLLHGSPSETPFGKQKTLTLRHFIEQSLEQFQRSRPDYFAKLLPAAHQWRLFSEFQHSTAYLDIETTGMGDFNDHITTVALYDGKTIYHYVQGKNLHDFEEQIKEYHLLVTYNGKCFDLPFIRNTLNIHLEQAHIDLRYVLASLGYRGGLKGCERQMGIDRAELDGIDGFFAVLLWQDYIRNGNERALETLLAYNIQDVVNLEILMVTAYNLKLKETPFSLSHQLQEPCFPQIPFQPDLQTIEKIRRAIHWGW
jgi:uncharacterized protein